MSGTSDLSSMKDVRQRLAGVAEAIARAAARVSRDPASVTLVAVSKRKSVGEMQQYAEAASARGISVIFGESYVQELKAKRGELSVPGDIHLIGPLQSNKVRDAVRLTDVIESVHSRKIIAAIAQEARAIGKRQSILLQVNIGHDPQKSGFSAEEIASVCKEISVYGDCLALQGLMTITPLYAVVEDVRRDFKAMRELREALVTSRVHLYFESHTILLSMGMSSDFEIAIEEGADIIRVGTALFGDR
jgi:pyridoxal phosphate enzyme (YggS family)